MLTNVRDIKVLIENYKGILKNKDSFKIYKELNITKKDIRNMIKELEHILPIGYKRIFLKYAINDNGDVINMSNKKSLRQETSFKGYKKVAMYVNKEKKKMYIHKLVRHAFEGVPYSEKARHLDKNKNNNNINNLVRSEKCYL